MVMRQDEFDRRLRTLEARMSALENLAFASLREDAPAEASIDEAPSMPASVENPAVEKAAMYHSMEDLLAASAARARAHMEGSDASPAPDDDAAAEPAAGVLEVEPGAASILADETTIKLRPQPAAGLRGPFRGGSAPRASSSPKGLGLEERIGGRVFAVAGALAVVVAVVLFLKLAVDQGWIGHMPPLAKCMTGGAFGVLLLGAGEGARRRVNAWAASGLSSAGVASIYASVYAAYAMYKLMAAPEAFVALTACVGLGVFVGARARLAVVAGVAIIGGFLAPLLVAGNASGWWVLPPYVLMLLATGLALAGWLRGAFDAVGTLAWWGTLALGTAWLAQEGSAHAETALVFVALVWAMVHASKIVGARLAEPGDLAEGDEEREMPVKNTVDFSADVAMLRRAYGGSGAIITSLAVTAWTVAWAVRILSDTRMVPAYLAPAAGMAATLSLALTLAGHLRVWIDRPRNARERFGAGLLFQAGGLLIVTVAMAFVGYAGVVAWLALGLAAAGAGRWIRSTALDAYATVLLLLGTGAAGLIGLEKMGAGEAVLGVWVSPWTGLALGAAAAWLACGRVMLVGRGERLAAWLARDKAAGWAVVGAMLLLAMVVGPGANGLALVVAWTLISAAFVGAGLAQRGMGLDLIGAAAMALTAGAWGVMVARPALEGTAAATHVIGDVLDERLVVALVVGAGLLTAWRVVRRRREQGSIADLGMTMIVLAVMLALAATSMQVWTTAERVIADGTARVSAVSVWWGLFAVGMIVAGFRLRSAAARRAGLALLAIAGGKVVFMDLVDVGPVWRVVSFLALGLLMMGVAWGYAKVSKAAREQRIGGAPRPSDQFLE